MSKQPSDELTGIICIIITLNMILMKAAVTVFIQQMIEKRLKTSKTSKKTGNVLLFLREGWLSHFMQFENMKEI